MNTKYLFIIIGIIQLLLSACNNKNNNTGITYFAYQETENGKWGFVTNEGEVVVPPIFQSMPTAVTDDMFFVSRQDGTYELHNINEPEKIIDANYISVGAFSNGLAPVVTKEERNISYINKEGEKVFNLPNDIIQASTFIENKAIIIDNNNKFGMIDTKGNIVIPIQYRVAIPSRDGHILVMNENQEIYYINGNGEKIYNITDNNGENLDYVRDFFEIWVNGTSENLAPYVTSKGAWGIQNINGKIIVEANEKYKRIVMRDDGYSIFTTDKGDGIMDSKGNIIVKDKYESINYCNKEYFIAQQGNEYAILSINEKKVIPQTFSDILSIDRNYIIGICNGKSILLNRKCKKLGEYSMLSDKISMYAQCYYSNQ